MMGNGVSSDKIRFVRLILVALVLISAACAKDVVTGKTTLNYYSIDSEIRLGNYVMKQQLDELTRAHKTYDSDKDKRQLTLLKYIVDDIAKVSHYPNFPYEVHLANLPIVNAWCAPGGKVMVYEGLWDPMRGLVQKTDVDELAAVLAHEIAHANARHVTEAISKNTTIYTLGSIMTGVASAGIGRTGGLFRDVFDEGFRVFVPYYSRQNEAEADRLGLYYMSKAGYDPRAMVRIWERAAKMKRGNEADIYATHPTSKKRQRLLEKYLPKAIEIFERACAEGRGRCSDRIKSFISQKK